MSLKLTPVEARCLFLRAQRLDAPPPAPADAAALLDIARALGCLQLDPIRVVARNRQPVLSSRAGPYDRAALDQRLWRDRTLFEHWAHCATIVLTEHYPIHSARLRAYRAPAPTGQTPWDGSRMRRWVPASLRRFILSRLKERGPLLSRQPGESGVDLTAWAFTGWTSGRNVGRMLDYLWLSGQIMVTARQGGRKCGTWAGACCRTGRRAGSSASTPCARWARAQR